MTGTLAPNMGFIVIGVLFIATLVAVMFKETVLEFVKANFGLLVLLTLFMTLLAISFHVFHESSDNTVGKDFLAWLEQKAGEVLASIMTVIVGARAGNQRASDSGGNGNTTTTTSGSSTKTTTSTTAAVPVAPASPSLHP
jgi:hypothetical protein